MLCFEIWVNGDRLFTIGHKDALTLDAGISFHRKHSEQFLGAHAVVLQDSKEATELFWETPRLGIGDDVRIALVESNTPASPHHELPYAMKLLPPWGENDGRCSFCGATAAERKMLFDGPKVKICDKCIEFRYRIIANEQSTIG